MKILYIKNNSERAKQFQLKTIIYEIDGEKFVKKQALCKEAIVHLKNMKDSYIKLSNSIINPKVKLAKIIDEEDDSLTFQFINGISLETKYKNALKHNEKKADSIINEYKELLNKSFKTIIFDNKNMINDNIKDIFGSFNYRQFDGKVCFDGVSNIDLIFSNIIYKDDDIYIIDYEWVFDFSLPLEYIYYRFERKDNSLFKDMDNNFINNLVVQKGYLEYSKQYKKEILNIKDNIAIREYNFIQLFIDIGEGIIEKDSIIKSIDDIKNNIIIFDTIYYKNIQLIRFDPLNNYSIVKINFIKVDDKELDILNTNAFYQEDNIYYFNTIDPQIFLAINKNKINTIKIDIEYIAIGNLAKEKFSHIYQNILEKKLQKIENLNQNLSEKSQKIENSKQNLNEKSKKIENLNKNLNKKSKEIENLNQNLNEKSKEIENLNQNLNEKDLDNAIFKIKLQKALNEK